MELNLVTVIFEGSVIEFLSWKVNVFGRDARSVFDAFLLTPCHEKILSQAIMESLVMRIIIAVTLSSTISINNIFSWTEFRSFIKFYSKVGKKNYQYIFLDNSRI